MGNYWIHVSERAPPTLWREETEQSIAITEGGGDEGS